jgi:CBS domain-containing protein
MQPQLASAFPHAFDRQYAVVKPSYPLITVLYLLKIQELAAVPLTSGKRDENRAVFGFSCLEKLVKLGPTRFASLLRRPCEGVADELDCLTTDQDLGDLLDSFKARRLGCAVVRAPGPYGRRTLLTLSDVMRLYERGLIKTDMVAQDVASPIFSMPGDTSIRDALQAMFRHQFRRVFISDDGRYISERTVINHILNPLALVGLDEEPPADHLAAPIGRLESVAPIPTGPHLPLKDAATKLRKRGGDCLIMNGDEVVTSWDLVMKPWISGRLVVGEVGKTPIVKATSRLRR